MGRTLPILLLLATPAQAQPMPRCGPALDGQMAQGGCTCSHEDGGTLLRRPPGWRWHCDLLRGPGPDASAPADLPASIGY